MYRCIEVEHVKYSGLPWGLMWQLTIDNGAVPGCMLYIHTPGGRGGREREKENWDIIRTYKSEIKAWLNRDLSSQIEVPLEDFRLVCCRRTSNTSRVTRVIPQLTIEQNWLTADGRVAKGEDLEWWWWREEKKKSRKIIKKKKNWINLIPSPSKYYVWLSTVRYVSVARTLRCTIHTATKH